MDFSAIPINSLALSEVIITLASALGCGLLIGLERERSKQRENQQSFAGLRSFAICALLGAICFLGGVLKSMLTLNEAIIDVKEG